MSRAFRWTVYWSTVIAVTGMLIAITISRIAICLWFGVLPVVCMAFLHITKAKVGLSVQQLVMDIRRYWRFIIYFAIYQLSVEVMAHGYLLRRYYRGGEEAYLTINVIAMLSNVIEEILFRSAFITGLELLERRLCPKISRNRIVVLSSASFALIHLHYLLEAADRLTRYGSIMNIVIAFLAGLLLGTIYYRSRNLLSTVVLHWWLNLQSDILEYLVLRLFA